MLFQQPFDYITVGSFQSSNDLPVDWQNKWGVIKKNTVYKQEESANLLSEGLVCLYSLHY